MQLSRYLTRKPGNVYLVNETSCFVPLLFGQSASRVVWLILNATETESNRVCVLQNQNQFQERAAGKWCKCRLLRKFSCSTRATSRGTPQAIQQTLTLNLYVHITIFLEKVFPQFVRCGVRTHAHFHVPELKSGALDHSANLTVSAKGCIQIGSICFF